MVRGNQERRADLENRALTLIAGRGGWRAQGTLPAEWQAVGKVWLLPVDKAGCTGAAKTQGWARMNEAWREWEGLYGAECCGRAGNLRPEHQ